jgi:tryptophan 2,3-dioxygenase
MIFTRNVGSFTLSCGTPPRMAQTDYERYIRTDDLLALQKPAGGLSCHDEMQFQIVHQAAELWMKLVAHELEHVVGELDRDEVFEAVHTLKRVHGIQRLLVQQMDLLDTMAPKDYMTIRTVLGRGSGQESPGFRGLLKAPGESLWPAMLRLLERKRVALRDVYEHHASHPGLYHLCEAYLDLDQLLQTWRQRHLTLVYRIIGAGTPSLKGKPSELLERGMKQRFFPALWDVRDEVFEEWTRTMLEKGKETGYHG